MFIWKITEENALQNTNTVIFQKKDQTNKQVKKNTKQTEIDGF